MSRSWLQASKELAFARDGDGIAEEDLDGGMSSHPLQTQIVPAPEVAYGLGPELSRPPAP